MQKKVGKAGLTLALEKGQSLCPAGELIPGVNVIPEIPLPETYFEITNTAVIEDPINQTCIVVDPGSKNEGHLDEVIGFCKARGLDIVAAIVTHSHLDHAGCREEFVRRTGAPFLGVAFGNLEPGPLVISRFAPRIEAISTPGHSFDSVSFYLPERSLLFIGDTCFEDSSVQLSYPDGRLDDYLETLDLLADLVAREKPAIVLPGHRAPLSNPLLSIESAKNRRLKRFAQMAALIEDTGVSDPYELTLMMYPSLDGVLLMLAFTTTLTNLVYASELGKVELDTRLPESYWDAIDSFEIFLRARGDERAIHVEHP